MTRLKLNPTLLAAVAAGVTQLASAINYSAGDLILVFRKEGAGPSTHVNNAEFDLGPVSTFLAYAPGSVHAVSYNQSLVTSSFGGSLANVKFAVVGATSPLASPLQAWVTDGKTSIPPVDMTRSSFTYLRDKIEAVGVDASYGTASNSLPYVVDSQNNYAFDSVVTGGQPLNLPPSTLGGDAPLPAGSFIPLPVDAINPTTVAFYQIGVSSSPQPQGTLIGAFTMDVNGNLTFTAGKLPVLPASTITQVAADPVILGQSTVSFTTATGANYQLFWAPSVSGPWSQVSGSGVATGNGTVQSLSDNAATDDVRFYRVLTTY